MASGKPRPKLGAAVKASGYMVRYESKGFNPDAGAIGWKRKLDPVEGVFFGVRRLQIGWWWTEFCGEGEQHLFKWAGYFTVYAIAINTRAVRYVLPRDVEVTL